MTDCGFDQGTPVSLGSVLYTCMKKFRNRIAQYEDETDHVDTYGALLTRCVRAAIKLRELGIGEDDIVSTCSHNHRNSCVPFVASTFIGAIPAAFDPALPQTDSIPLLRLMEPKIMFVSQEALKDFEICMEKAQVKPAHIVVFGDSQGKYMTFDDFLEPKFNERQFKVYETSNPKKTAVIVFSSGTTGLPKGICLSHYTLLKKTGWLKKILLKVTRAFITPYVFSELLHERSKKVLTTGSCNVVAKQLIEVMEAFPDTLIYNMYGQSEVCGLIAVLSEPGDYHFQKEKPTTVGKILSDYKWKIVDLDTEQPVTGPNKKGEVRLKTDHIMNGYYKMDCSDAFDSEGYFRTGDVAYYAKDNCLFIDDRVRNIFKYRGWHILPAGLEGVLMEHPAVKEAAVIGIPHPGDGAQPMGLVVLKKGYEDATPEEIRKFADDKLSNAQKLRAGIKVVDKLVRTPTGKVKRKALREAVHNNK